MPRTSQPAPADATPRWLLWLLPLLTCAAYYPALRAGFIWDDDAYVTSNLLLRDLPGLWRIWSTTGTPQYYPLVFSSFWIEYQLWGLDPLGYHLVNVLLHAANGLLVGLILQRQLRVRGAWWIAALFLVHPVHVESVAWITERKNVLSGLFYLVALQRYLRFEDGGRRRDYAAALGAFVCALLSKTVTASLPVVLGLLLLYRRRRLTPADGWRLTPFLGLAALLAAVTVTLESGMVRAVSYDFELSLAERGWIACRALLFYAQKLLVPYPLIFNYPRWDPGGTGLLDGWPVVAVALILAGAVAAWRRGARGAVICLAFFGVTLFPALGFLDVYPFRYSFVADHFQYLASLGLLVLLVQIASRLGAGLGSRGAGLAAGLIVLLLAGLTWSQSRAYRDLRSLWQDTLAKNPSSWLALNNLGLIQLLDGELPAALRSFDAALLANPRAVESHTGRGMVYMRMERPDAALADLDRAIELDPLYPQAYINRGQLYAALQRHDEAIRDLTRVLEFKPDLLSAYKSRGMAYLALGRHDEALGDFTAALRFGANFEAHNDRGAAYLQAGQAEAALRDFDQALRLNPRAAHVYHNRGVARVQLQRYEEALQDFTRVIELDPRALKSYRVRGGLYMTAYGDRLRACADWRQACDLGECQDFRAHCPAGP